MNRGRYTAVGALVLVTSFATGIAFERLYLNASGGSDADGEKILYWVAPMDPNFRKDGPGKSPMGMDLVPVYEGAEPSGDPAEVKLSAQEVNAIGVRLAVARVEPIAPIIDTVGFVTYDEDATSHVHARIAGWVEDIRVKAVGDPVKAGQPLFEVYGPRQERETVDRVGQAAEFLQVTAPQSGVITALSASEGMYLEPGVRALSITDLSSVWVLADVFERDIGRLTEGMKAEARFDPLPNEVFIGEVDYIYPELDQKTRTLTVRLRFKNEDTRLKPNMYGRIKLEADNNREAVTVPSEAIIRTGRAERVILKTGDGTFKPRLITTGLRDGFGSGGRTEIVQGLNAGEEVVASAQFLIDSESSLSAGTTRMAPTDAEQVTGKGILVSVDDNRNTVTIAHAPITSLDWPEMSTEFALRNGVKLERVNVGEDVRFSLSRGSDGLLSLTKIGSDDGVDATAKAIINSVTADGKLNVSHEPIPSLNWPAMTMDMPAQGFDLTNVPLETEVEIDLSESADGLYAIISVRTADEKDTAVNEKVVEAKAPEPANEPSSDKVDLIAVKGVVNSIDPNNVTANLTHGPIKEIGMPGMTMDFKLAPNVSLDALPIGVETGVLLSMNPETFEMVIEGIEK